ncbi:hypothetical protein BH20ACI1_BH20ACI1_19290 [soil metagenome]
MFSENKSQNHEIKYRLINLVMIVLFTTVEVWSQMPSVPVPSPEAEQVEDFTWWYISLFVLCFGLVGAVLWWHSKRNAGKKAKTTKKKANAKDDSWEIGALDANKELEWLRRNHKAMGAQSSKKLPSKPKFIDVQAMKKSSQNGNGNNQPFLPIFSIDKLKPARPFEPLPLSNDPALISAIEQTQDEFEEDETVRELAVRILNAFKNRNSVEALSQVALYDLSANLRSKAVTILSDFDHESVFSTILIACADPTREVRAAAARALTRLSCNRADAWTRIIETEEEGRMVQAARAAIEGDMVERTFSRLVHSDRKFAYEGFTLFALLIKANETDAIFKALEKHEDLNVRRAILHVIKVTKNQKALEGLYTILERKTLPLELQEEVDKTIEEIGFVTA